jgi:sterol desaturase/sphingolipid hydroxylase (fatty acid hydroxylase superfamily)
MESEFLQVENQGRAISVAVLLALLLWETLNPFFEFFRTKASKRGQHGLRNFSLGILNAVMISIVFVALWMQATIFAETHSIGLLNLVDFSPGLEALIAILLFDLWTYLWHRLNHRIPFLWRFHKVHHSDIHMDVSTAFRFHIGEIFLSSTLRILLLTLLGAKLWHLAVYEAIMFPIVQFHHANIGLSDSLDRFLRIFIVTPAMHKIHHSDYQPETDSNYTSMLSIWDRLFMSFRMRGDLKNISLGLGGEDEQKLLELLKSPMDK